jgi:predicted AAA+ superfamily ATPase
VTLTSFVKMEKAMVGNLLIVLSFLSHFGCAPELQSSVKELKRPKYVFAKNRSCYRKKAEFYANPTKLRKKNVSRKIFLDEHFSNFFSTYI